MSRLPLVLIAAVAALGLGGVQLAQSQTEQAPPAAQTAPAAKKKAMTAEEKAQRKAERKAKRQAMTPEEKANLKQERAAKKAKRQECVAQGKQDNLKGKKLREFMKTCTAG